MTNYLVDALGRRPEQAARLIEQDLARERAADTVDDLNRLGIPVKGLRVLDLGAGLGELSAELSSRGAHVYSVKPGRLWRDIVQRRVEEPRVVGAVGEFLPFGDESFDLIVSLQVLEHVKSPDAVVNEAYRVCRKGGAFYFSCENYLSFREAHYGIFWLPLMPKWLGSLYLRLRGRSPEFLNNSVTYTTMPGVSRALRESGFETRRARDIAAKIRATSDLKSGPKRVMVALLARVMPQPLLVRMAIRAEQAWRTFDYLVQELCYRPLEG